MGNSYEDETGEVKAIDFNKYQLDIHDRFLFVYDPEEGKYVLLLHFGASINNYSLNIVQRHNYSSSNSFRISEIEEINMNDDEDKNNKLLKQLETIYFHETGKEKWGF